MLLETTAQRIALDAYRDQSDPDHRYVVVTQNDRRGEDGTAIYVGGNYDKAVEVTNFWDERVNTWLITIDSHLIEAVELKMRQERLKAVVVSSLAVAQLDTSVLVGNTADYFANLSAEQKLDVYTEAALSRIA